MAGQIRDRLDRANHYGRAAAIHPRKHQGLQLLAFQRGTRGGASGELQPRVQHEIDVKPAPSGQFRDANCARDSKSPGLESLAPVIELRGITKRFGAVEVLSKVDLSLRAGQVHSLAGENGAGKSTLVKILGGLHQPDSGKILKNGIETAIVSSADARRQGIAVIH